MRPADPSARLCGGKEGKDHGGEIGNGGADDRGVRDGCGVRAGVMINQQVQNFTLVCWLILIPFLTM